MESILQIKGLCKSFDQTQVLNQVNLAIGKGEFVAVMGQSGSGKSTLLYNVSGMDRPTSGSVTLNGNEITKLSEEQLSEIRLQKMGFVFQHSFLLKNLSIFDNIVLPGFKSAKCSREEVISHAKSLMKKTGIENVADHDIKKVSGGQLQRAAICRALINNPELLFGDEPTGALNSSASTEVMDIFNTINAEGTTIILVTHDSKVAARADRILFFADGTIRDQLLLPKYTPETRITREKQLVEWLEKQSF